MKRWFCLLLCAILWLCASASLADQLSGEAKGFGGAGIAAALEVARSSDYSMLLLEKEAWIGGSTALSGGGIAVVNTVKNQGEEVDFVFSNDGKPMDCEPEDIVAYYQKVTEGLSKRPEGMEINGELVRRIFERSSTYYPYLMEHRLDQRYGIPAKTSEEMGMPGKGIMGLISGGMYSAGAVWSDWFSDLARENGAEIRVNAKVTELLVEDGAVCGVTVETPDSVYDVRAKKVILTTGGFAANREMQKTYNSAFANIERVWPFCAPGCTGDALEMVKAVNAATTGYGIIMQLGVAEPYAFDTMYGVKQDEHFRVLNEAGEPIPNLYAAGWVGGGNYMLQKYYCTTNAIAIAVYGGSLAGEEAVLALSADQ